MHNDFLASLMTIAFRILSHKSSVSKKGFKHIRQKHLKANSNKQGLFLYSVKSLQSFSWGAGVDQKSFSSEFIHTLFCPFSNVNATTPSTHTLLQSQTRRVVTKRDKGSYLGDHILQEGHHALHVRLLPGTAKSSNHFQWQCFNRRKSTSSMSRSGTFIMILRIIKRESRSLSLRGSLRSNQNPSSTATRSAWRVGRHFVSCCFYPEKVKETFEHESRVQTEPLSTCARVNLHLNWWTTHVSLVIKQVRESRFLQFSLSQSKRCHQKCPFWPTKAKKFRIHSDLIQKKTSI